MEIVKGNDIRVVWAITKLVDNVNVPEDLSTASNIRFKVICSGTYIQVPDYSISGNEITFTIKGSAQRTGLYSFEVSYSKGYDARVVYKDAFTVVDLACQANYVKPDDIQITTLEFYSCISSLYLWQLLDVEKSTTDNSVKNSLDDFYLGYDAKSKTWYGKQIPPETFKLEDMWRELDATNEIIPKHHLDLSGLTTEHYVDQIRQYLQEQIDDLSSRGGAVDEAQVTEIILRLLGRWFKEDENQDIYVVQKSVPKLDEEGNPVMDANGKPMYVEVGRGLYTTGFLSAKGKQTGSGGGGTGGGLIQTVYGSKDLGGTFKDDDLNNTFNAYTINAINTKTDNAVTLATEAKTLATTAKTAADNATTLANKAIADAKTANDKAQQAIDIASKFNRFFTAINASGGEIAADDTTTAIESIRANYSLWTNGYLSAKGQQQGSGGGTGGLVTTMYRWDDLGGTFDNNANDTFNAYTINRIYQLANTQLTVTGSGNAVTNITLGSGNLTVTKGESFATKAEFNTLNTKVTNFLEGTDTDDIINKWKELEAFLSGMKESDNLAAILATKADKSYVDSTFVTLATAQTITGAKTFTTDLKTSNILPITNTTSSLGSDILRWLSGYYNSFIQIGDVRLEYDAAKTALKIIHKDGTTNVGLYSTGWLSAKGAQVGGSSGGGLISTIYRFADLGGTFDDSNNDTFTAYTINEIWKIAQDSGIKNITITGSGNAITDLVPSSDGKTLTASKGITFATAASVTTLSNSKADKTITLTAGTGLTGGGDLSADRTFALATSGVTAGTYAKVTVDVYGRVTKGAALAEGDIPNLPWSKITGKPTTIAGYGITDAYTKTETDTKYVTLATAQEISGGKTFLTDLRTSHILPSATGAKNLGGSTLRWLNTFTATLDATNVVVADSIRIGNGLIKWDSVNNAVYFVHTQADTTVGVYSTGWMSTMGVQVGGGTVSSLADLTDVTLTSPTNNQVLTYDSATSKWINKTIQTGLDLTAMWNELKKADTTKVIDVSHIPNLPWSKITSGKPTTLAGYGITDAYTKAEADGRYVTALGTSGNNLTWTKNGTVNNITVPYATKSGSSDWLNTNTKLTYGASGLNYFNFNGTAGTTANANVTPVAGWHHILRMNHNNASGYFADIAVPMNTVDGIYWRQIRGGNNYGWYKLLDTNNYASTLGSVYVKKTGDTMTGLLTLKTGSLHTGIKCGNSYMSAIDGSVIFQNNAGGIRFSTIDNWDWNVWAGLKYVHSSKTVYLGLADGTIFTTNTAQTGGTVSMVNCKVQADYYLARNTTLCTNLNANYLEGYTNMGFIHSNFSAQTGGTAYASGDTHRMKVAEIAINTHYSSYVLLLSHEFWGHQHYSALLLHIAVTNNDNSGNKNPRCAVHVMSRTGNNGNINPVYYKVENNKAYIYIEVYGGNSYGNWNTTILQARDSITVSNANSRGNIKLTFEFNQPTANVVAANYDNYINAMGFMDGSNQNTFVRKAGDTMTGTLTITSSLALQARVSAGTWAYFRLYNGSKYWDLATQSTRNNNFEIRYQGADAVRWDFKPDGALVPSKTTLCTNLNADMLDSVHLAGFGGNNGVIRSWSRGQYTTVNQYFGNGNIVTLDPTPTDAGGHLNANTTILSLGDAATRNIQIAALYGGSVILKARNCYDGPTWTSWVTLLHTGNYTATLDSRYVNVTGDTMSGSLTLSAGHVYIANGWFQNNSSGQGLYNSNQDARWFAQNNRWNADKYIRAPYFEATVGTGTQPYKCSSTTLNTNLNADMLDSWHASGTSGACIVKYGYTVNGTSAAWSRLAKYSISTSETLSNVGFLLYSSFNDRWGILHIRARGKEYVYGELMTSFNIDLNKIRIYYSSDKTGVELYYYAGEGYSVMAAKLLYSTGRIGNWDNNVTMYYANTTAPSWSAYVTPTISSLQNNVSSATRLQTARTINGTNFNGTANIVTSYWGTSRNFYIQDNWGSYTGTAISVNGSGNPYLKLPSTIRADSFAIPNRGGCYFKVGGGDNANEVGSTTTSNIEINSWYGVTFTTTCTGQTYTNKVAMSVNCRTGRVTANNFHAATNVTANGAITAKSSSSDIRLKRDIKDFTAMDILRKIQPKQFYWNEIAKSNSPALNNDYRQYGLIAQSIQNMPELEGFVDNVFKDYLVIHYEKFIPIALEGLKEVDDEVTKLKRRVEVLERENEVLKRRIPA